MEPLTITLDDEEASQLAELAQRLGVAPTAAAHTLLVAALRGTTSDAGGAKQLLDGIPRAYERAQLGLSQARAGETVPLDRL